MEPEPMDQQSAKRRIARNKDWLKPDISIFPQRLDSESSIVIRVYPNYQGHGGGSVSIEAEVEVSLDNLILKAIEHALDGFGSIEEKYSLKETASHSKGWLGGLKEDLEKNEKTFSKYGVKVGKLGPHREEGVDNSSYSVRERVSKYFEEKLKQMQEEIQKEGVWSFFLNGDKKHGLKTPILTDNKWQIEEDRVVIKPLINRKYQFDNGGEYVLGVSLYPGEKRKPAKPAEEVFWKARHLSDAIRALGPSFLHTITHDLDMSAEFVVKTEAREGRPGIRFVPHNLDPLGGFYVIEIPARLLLTSVRSGGSVGFVSEKSYFPKGKGRGSYTEQARAEYKEAFVLLTYNRNIGLKPSIEEAGEKLWWEKNLLESYSVKTMKRHLSGWYNNKNRGLVIRRFLPDMDEEGMTRRIMNLISHSPASVFGILPKEAGDISLCLDNRRIEIFGEERVFIEKLETLRQMQEAVRGFPGDRKGSLDYMSVFASKELAKAVATENILSEKLFFGARFLFSGYGPGKDTLSPTCELAKTAIVFDGKEVYHIEPQKEKVEIRLVGLGGTEVYKTELPPPGVLRFQMVFTATTSGK